MRNSKTINVLSIIVVSITLNCSEKSNEFFDPSYWAGPYKGITFTDQYGMQQKVDPDDWCVGEPYPLSSVLLPVEGSYAFVPAFPNPVYKENEIITFRFFTKQASNIKIEIFNDKYLSVKILADSIFENGLHEMEWDLLNNINNKVPSGIYRCYMIADDFSCHGDIWVK